MTEFRTDISENGKKFELVFQTDNKAYFEKMQAMARECIDHKPVTQFDRIKAMSVEEMAECSIPFFNCPYDTPYVGCDMGKKFDDDCIKCTKAWLEQEVSE